MKKRINIMVDESYLPLIDKFASSLSMSRSEYLQYCFLKVADEHFTSNWDLFNEIRGLDERASSLLGLVCSLHSKVDILADYQGVKFPDFL